MKELLCRGKATDFDPQKQGQWVEGYYTLYPQANGLHPCILTGTEEGAMIPVFVEPETVGQLIKVRKNGERVFENDIVQCKLKQIVYDTEHPILDFDRGTFHLPEIKSIVLKYGVVRWCEDLAECRIYLYYKTGEFDCRIPLHDCDIQSMRVVGNIHDNPELLGSKGEAV